MRDISRLISEIDGGSRTAHAFIVEGRSGEMREGFITKLAAGLECGSDVSRPCGVCAACRQVAAGTSMDVVRMSKSTGSGKGGRESYRTDDAALFIERLNMGAYGKYLIGIIDDADTLSEVIQNKLLKTLEEPSPGTVLILAASNRDNLLSTVRSRCSDIRLSDYTEEEKDADEERTDDPAFTELAAMLTDRGCRFHEFRAAMERTVKSREDALRVLDVFSGEMRKSMRGEVTGIDPVRAAECAELAAVLEMDIRRDMNHSRGLKRLYLEIREMNR